MEKPFRQPYRYSRKFILVSSILALLFFISFGLSGHLTNGFSDRFQGEQRELLDSAKSSPLRNKCHFPRKEAALEQVACTYFSGTPSVAVFGNSHGTELSYAMAKQLKNYNQSLVQHTMTGCMHNFEKSDESKHLYRWHRNVVEAIINNNLIQTVIISYRNETYLGDTSYRNSLLAMINALAEAKNKIILVPQAPLANMHINKYLVSALRREEINVKGLSRSEWKKIYSAKIDLLSELPKGVI